MGSIGTAEVIVVLVAALLILGPQRLPGAARQVGKAITEFRRMANGLQDDVKAAFTEDQEPPRYPTPPPSAVDAALSPPVIEPPAYTPPATPRDAELPAPPDDPSRN